MIERIIEASIRNRFLVLIVAAGLTAWGIYAVLHTPMDAIPDLSENQVIVFTDWMGRSPKEIEEQVTYPLSLKLQGLAGVKTIRSSSEFNFSMITIIFEDKVNYYFARQRVTEKLLGLTDKDLPPDVTPYLAPDATALGQVFWYTVEGGQLDQARLWALQKYYIGPQLNSASGVAEVAAVGGMPLEYQIDVRPESLRAYEVTLGDLYAAVAKSNMTVGGRVVHKNNAEFLVRGVGWIKGKEDIENTVIREKQGTPIFIKNVATVQLGPQFRRSVFEKDGNEVVGGVVMMRYGENPLAVTQRIKDKIQELQPGLPEGVRIVPAYDRTRLIHGAIDTLTTVMWHEMVIASLAVFLILWHVRSAFVICVTLPLSVLFAFLLMWVLRVLNIIDIQANIMSLAGITISIGILVDQAIVMVENATHHLKEHFREKKVTGDIRELVIPACRIVGRPIFFSVMIMLISFIPVFALSGREGKYFHPLAFTKTFALIGVAIISVTVVPALIPTFIKGRLRSEEENWIVRSFINIYKPVLTWALPRRNLVMWGFAVLLILAAAMFPLPALIGLGASEWAWRICFLAVLFIVVSLTVIFTRGAHWQALSFLTLVLLALAAYSYWAEDPKSPGVNKRIGVSFMPALDEGSTLDMPITVPRASVTQAADDLKARDALLRGFPEVESVIGKAGRADTATDPAPLDMVETFINFRPKELWPRRVIKFHDGVKQTRQVLAALEDGGYLRRADTADERDSLINDATMKALERFDETMRELALQHYREFEQELGLMLTRFVGTDAVARFRLADLLREPADFDSERKIDELTGPFSKEYGPSLAKNPALEDVTKITRALAQRLYDRKAFKDWFKLTKESLDGLKADGVPESVLSKARSLTDKNFTTEKEFLKELEFAVPSRDLASSREQIVRRATYQLEPASALELREPVLRNLLSQAEEVLGSDRKTFAGEVLQATSEKRMALWRERVKRVNWELFDQGVVIYTAYAMEDLAKLADMQGLVSQAKKVSGTFSEKGPDTFLAQLRDDLAKPFAKRVFFWPRTSGPKGDLVDDEMGRVLQVPGWSNIFTQPIINRIDMLSTGVRTDIGVKVFGPNLETIDQVCKEIERVLKPVPGSRDVVAAQIMGKGYLEITPDRIKAARYGVSVADINDTIEVALGGRVVTQTVEERERFPVRIRYARSQREDEESVRRLLVSAGSMATAPMNASPRGMSGPAMSGEMRSPMTPLVGPEDPHQAAPAHSGQPPMQIPLGEVAEVRIVEGPAMIKSENGRLMNYVTLNVRGRDTVGFVDEAQRVVAEKVQLPSGVHIEWAGEFEHQVRASRTLRFVFPAVIVLIFIILYLTYKDLADAALMMLAVPEALAGGAFFMYLFPKIKALDWSAPPEPFSVTVWIGFIACFGMATETGIIMLVYLREAIDKRGGLENIKSLEELRQAVIEGAVHRLRPKLLTEGVAIIAIAPMLWASGVGGEILAPMALPVLGGLLISDEVVDIFLPVRFYWVRRARWLEIHQPR